MSDQIEEYTKKINSLHEAIEITTTENSNQISQFMENIKAKEMIIENMKNEARQLKSTVKSQEASVAYFKKKIDELNTKLEQEKMAKSQLTIQTMQLPEKSESICIDSPI